MCKKNRGVTINEISLKEWKYKAPRRVNFGGFKERSNRFALKKCKK
jgi:hypothetical protein